MHPAYLARENAAESEAGVWNGSGRRTGKTCELFLNMTIEKLKMDQMGVYGCGCSHGRFFIDGGGNREKDCGPMAWAAFSVPKCCAGVQKTGRDL